MVLVYRLDAVGDMAALMLRPESTSASSASPCLFAGQAHKATVRPVGFSASSGLGSSRIAVHCSTGRSRGSPTRILGLVGNLFGSLVADRGYLFCKLGSQRQGLLALPLSTKLRIQREKSTPVHSRPAPAAPRIFIEILIDQRKNSAQIEHSRPRHLWPPTQKTA